MRGHLNAGKRRGERRTQRGIGDLESKTNNNEYGGRRTVGTLTPAQDSMGFTVGGGGGTAREGCAASRAYCGKGVGSSGTEITQDDITGMGVPCEAPSSLLQVMLLLKSLVCGRPFLSGLKTRVRPRLHKGLCFEQRSKLVMGMPIAATVQFLE